MRKLSLRSVYSVLPVLFVLAFASFPGHAQQATDGEQKFANLGVCKLVNGQEIADCRLGYRTWGKLNADRSNAILFPTWFSGTSKDLIPAAGPNSLLDSNKYFVIVVDALGDGVSSSPSNSATQHGPAFPAFNTRDMVNAEYRLAMETLGLKHLHAVMGISMGGMQTFEWMVNYPEFMDDCIPIVGSTKLTGYDLLLWHAEENALRDDPAWQQGSYTKAPPMGAVAVIHSMNLTTPANFARMHPPDKFDADYAAMMKNGILPFDANDWLAQLEAMIHHDAAHGGSMEDAAKKVKARVLVVTAAQDHMVNPKPAMDFAALIGAKTFVLDSDCGHQSTNCQAAALKPVVQAFLNGK